MYVYLHSLRGQTDMILSFGGRLPIGLKKGFDVCVALLPWLDTLSVVLGVIFTSKALAKRTKNDLHEIMELRPTLNAYICKT